MIMATAAIGRSFVGVPATQADKSKPGFFQALFQRFITARETEARRRMAIYLASYSDDQLKALGMSARDVELVRHGNRFNVELAG
jgi:hypothetical protein